MSDVVKDVVKDVANYVVKKFAIVSAKDVETFVVIAALVFVPLVVKVVVNHYVIFFE